MIEFTLNGQKAEFAGDEKKTLLTFLRSDKGITSVKDGCSGQAACGACLVELDGKPALACSTPMKRVAGKQVITIEGFAENVRRTLGRAFVAKGAVQCGFCTPGMVSRAKILLENTPNPSRNEVAKALKANVCRCTGYVKIIDAVLLAAQALRQNRQIDWEQNTGIGHSYPKYEGYRKAIGTSDFIDDMHFEGMLYGVLKFSEHPRALVKDIDVSEAEKLPGVIRVFTCADIPGNRYQGLMVKDWPMMVARGEDTRCIGDVLAGVVAETYDIASNAVEKIRVDYDVLEPVTCAAQAAQSQVFIHENGNLLDKSTVRRGEPVEDVFARSAHVVEAIFETPFIEHGFLETEASIAHPDGENKLVVYSQSQGIYKDRMQIASVLDLAEENIDVVQVSAGGGFGGKEDLTVQHHAALYSLVLQRPVKVRLNRAESIRMHPKRHHMVMDYKIACDENGRLTALRARIIGDTGAYASMGKEVVARTGTHAAGAYHVPHVDVSASVYYTNNPPAGAFRGFGVNQSNFAMESLVDELCAKGGFDRWQFRYANALDTGKMTTTGHVLGEGIGLKECLEAVKEAFDKSSCAGLACGIKNCGIGNGVEEVSEIRINVVAPGRIEILHGWTEMGQGIHTVARQILCEVAGLDASVDIDIKSSTGVQVMSGVTTASRGTVLLGNAVIAAAKKLKADLSEKPLADLTGKTYFARYVVDWTSSHDTGGEINSHFAYGFAVHLAVLDDQGKLEKIYAAHDAGKIINPALYEGQIEGGVVMGMGYALSEKLPLEKARLSSERMSKLGLPKAKDVPEIEVIGVECLDPVGPFGAKGVGEIGTIPTAPAIANAYCRYDGQRRYSLPLSKLGKKQF
ncbi:MAG: selenium-dependent xanthine dehydrogenase [Desulfobacteraceae bacterium]|nr:selenium-dependent xanthine dehydrogenase [Desulfobacteraceae bacterium]